MSTDVKPMEKPSYLKTVDASDDAASLAASSTSVPRISLKGRKFRLIEGGDEQSKSDTLNVVMLGIEPEGARFIKAYYDGPYNPSDTSPPDCASSNGVFPDGWVSQPQADKCMTCPKNQFGSATSTQGKKAKACKDSKRAFVTLADNVSGTVYMLGIPVTSLRAAAEYGRFIRSEGVPLAACITELSMEDTEFPQLAFKLIGFLDESNGLKAIDISSNRPWHADKVSQSAAPSIKKPDYLAPVTDESDKNVDVPVKADEPAKSTSSGSSMKSVDDIVDTW